VKKAAHVGQKLIGSEELANRILRGGPQYLKKQRKREGADLLDGSLSCVKKPDGRRRKTSLLSDLAGKNSFVVP